MWNHTTIFLPDLAALLKPPKHVACALGNLGVVRFLLDKGAELQKLNTRGQTPMDLARQHSRDEVVRLLEETEGNVIQ